MPLRKALILIPIILVFNVCSRDKALKDYTLRGGVFGTTYKIIYLNAEKDYRNSIDSLFFLINNSLSTYIPTSDISRINKGDSTVVVDDFFLEVFNKSKRIYTETDGYFDPTVGGLVKAWGFGSSRIKKNLSDKEIEKYKQFVGLEKINIKSNKVYKAHPNIYLDFNSIAKGFGIDVVARFLNLKKVENYLIEIGGEVRAKGMKSKNLPWTIKLIDPTDKHNNKGFKNIRLSNKSMATSGNYRKFRIAKDGKKYVHIINPKTGYALESSLLSASVISNTDCSDVDAYATAFMAMGLEKTVRFLEKNKNLDAILIYYDKEKNLKEYCTFIDDTSLQKK